MIRRPDNLFKIVLFSDIPITNQLVNVIKAETDKKYKRSTRGNIEEFCAIV